MNWSMTRGFAHPSFTGSAPTGVFRARSRRHEIGIRRWLSSLRSRPRDVLKERPIGSPSRLSPGPFSGQSSRRFGPIQLSPGACDAYAIRQGMSAFSSMW